MKALKIIVAAAVAISFATLDAANAASKQKRHKARHPAPLSYAPSVAPSSLRTPGPAWATNPNDCYTDEGYGRYLRCGGGMDM
jgi:hypothetical protein